MMDRSTFNDFFPSVKEFGVRRKSLLLLLSLGLMLCLFSCSNSSGSSQTNSQANAPVNRQFEESELPLAHAPRASLEAAQKWARERSSTDLFPSLAPLYWKQAQQIGLDPLAAYCQAALETGFMKFSSVVPESFHNPCGLKTSTGGGDYDTSAHMQFPDWETGIQAHLDHLALYAGIQGYPRSDTQDPRHFDYLLGQAPTVESLSGRWAPSQEYGQILRKLMEEVLAYE